MRERIRGSLTYSNVMVTILAVVVLGSGIANATNQLGKNSVGTKQLKKNAVTKAKIKNEAITAVKVKAGTLTGVQINSSTLGVVPSAKVAGSAPPTGPAGGDLARPFWRSASPGLGEMSGEFRLRLLNLFPAGGLPARKICVLPGGRCFQPARYGGCCGNGRSQKHARIQ